jgi:hypothetical protein
MLNPDERIGSFCSICGTPSEVEAKLQGVAGPTEMQGWQAHLESSPTCQLAALQDKQLQDIFGVYQSDPLFRQLTADWQPDLTELSSRFTLVQMPETCPFSHIQGDFSSMSIKDKDEFQLETGFFEADQEIAELPEMPLEPALTQLSTPPTRRFPRVLALAASLALLLTALAAYWLLVLAPTPSTNLPAAASSSSNSGSEANSDPAFMSKPLIAPTPTPVSANSVAYLGPDNTFHSANSASLVSPKNSAKVSATISATTYAEVGPNGKVIEQNNDTTATADLQLDWLVSDPSGLRMEIRASGLPTPKPITATKSVGIGVGGSVSVSKAEAGAIVASTGPGYPLGAVKTGAMSFGTLKDENGHSYNLNVVNSMINDSDQLWVVTGASLPAGIHKVSFVPATGTPFSFTAPLTLDLQTFKEANLPQATPFPNAISDVNGIKVRIPYAYFGSDRTVLAVNLDQTGYQANFKNGTVFLEPFSPNLSISDDKGQPLARLGTKDELNFLTPYPQGDQILVLEPLRSGTKSLTVKLAEVEENMTFFPTKSEPAKANGPSLQIPLADLIKSGTPTKVDQTLDMQGLKVHVVSEQATLDTASQTVSVTIGYSQGSANNSPADTAIKFASFQCANCQTSLAGMGLKTVVLNGGDAPKLTTTTLPAATESSVIFKYDPSQTQLEFNLAALQFTQKGSWQINLAVPGQS